MKFSRLVRFSLWRILAEEENKSAVVYIQCVVVSVHICTRGTISITLFCKHQEHQKIHPFWNSICKCPVVDRKNKRRSKSDMLRRMRNIYGSSSEKHSWTDQEYTQKKQQTSILKSNLNQGLGLKTDRDKPSEKKRKQQKKESSIYKQKKLCYK